MRITQASLYRALQDLPYPTTVPADVAVWEVAVPVRPGDYEQLRVVRFHKEAVNGRITWVLDTDQLSGTGQADGPAGTPGRDNDGQGDRAGGTGPRTCPSTTADGETEQT